jgi:hypothetical protein
MIDFEECVNVQNILYFVLKEVFENNMVIMIK